MEKVLFEIGDLQFWKKPLRSHLACKSTFGLVISQFKGAFFNKIAKSVVWKKKNEKKKGLSQIKQGNTFYETHNFKDSFDRNNIILQIL